MRSSPIVYFEGRRNQWAHSAPALWIIKTGNRARSNPPDWQRGRRGSKREQLLDLIRKHPGGLARKEILEQLGLKGDKSGEMSVSNALTALTKANQVARAEGKYRVA